MTAAPTPADLLAYMPFAKAIGVEMDEATPEQVVARLPWSEDRCTAGGVLHGGSLVTLDDSAGAVCAFLSLPEGASTTTLDSTTTFVRGVREGTATAVSRPLHVGRTVIVVRTEVTDDDGRLVAHTVQTQAVRAAG
jgi:1,4-dihydroxy-2-naphthoyl-CoA hydrolase